MHAREHTTHIRLHEARFSAIMNTHTHTRSSALAFYAFTHQSIHTFTNTHTVFFLTLSHPIDVNERKKTKNRNDIIVTIIIDCSVPFVGQQILNRVQVQNFIILLSFDIY